MMTKRETQTRPSGIRRFLNTPKGIVLSVLAGLTLLAALRPQDHLVLVNVLVAVVTGLLVDGAVALLQKRKRLFSDGAVITGLIVASVLGHATPLWIVAATTVIALISKHIMVIGRKPLFNPAAVGLLVAIWVFHAGESWWASLALMPAWMTLIVLIAGLTVAVRVNKFPQVTAFLGTYFGLLLVMAISHTGLPSDTPADALRVPFVNSALYLAFFMLTDPPTSPAAYRQQVLFGILAAVVATAIFATVGGLSYLLLGLLSANLWKVVWVRGSQRRPAARERQRATPGAADSL